MALREDGAVVGSVSGGCIEDDLIYRLSRAAGGAVVADGAPGLPTGAPGLVKYGVTADEARRFGLPCGGTLELLLEYDPQAASLDELARVLEGGSLVQRTLRWQDGLVSLQAAAPPQALQLSATHFVNTFGPQYRMLLIGAGQLTEYLASMAMFSGFAVTVCDPRAEYRGSWSVAGTSVVRDMPDDVVAAFRPDRRSCVAALTHDPKLDDMALLEALKTDAFYVGAIGSRRNNAARRQRMIEHFGQSEAALALLRGPIGIFIGSKTPAEIAVSIMAEILAVKNGVVLPREMEVAWAKQAGLHGTA